MTDLEPLSHHKGAIITWKLAEEFVSILDEKSENQETVDAHIQQIRCHDREWEERRSLAIADGDSDNIHFLPEIIPHKIKLRSYLTILNRNNDHSLPKP